MTRWLAKLHSLNARWLYLGAAILLTVPFVVPIAPPPGKPSRAVLGLYDMIENCPPGKDGGIVWIDSAWDQGSRAENEAQLECVVRHLCRRHVRFVVTSLGCPFGPEFAGKVIKPIAEQEGRVYGRDWVNLGFVQCNAGLPVVINSLAKNFKNIREKDVDETPIGELALMKDVETIQNFYMVYAVTYSPPQEWVSFVRGQFGTPVAFGCMSIMGPYYQTFFESGQLSGMLVGNRGAAQYEAMLGHRSLGTKLSMVASFGNVAIILAALLGNLGMWGVARARRSPPR
jgi:hypothetical protein